MGKGRGVSVLYCIWSSKKESIRTICVIQICPTQISSAWRYEREQTKFVGDTRLVRALIPMYRLIMEKQKASKLLLTIVDASRCRPRALTSVSRGYLRHTYV